MVERTRGIDIAGHGILILGGLLVCLPIYFALAGAAILARIWNQPAQ